VFTVARWLGVGYSTLVHHIQASLHLIGRAKSEALLANSPRAIRKMLTGLKTGANVMVVDGAWTGRPVDVHVGDLIIISHDGTVEGTETSPLAEFISDARNGLLWEARRPGIGRIAGTEWSCFMRVSRRGYVGRSLFRHLEPAVDDEEAR
jgi:hypothetical protein